MIRDALVDVGIEIGKLLVETVGFYTGEIVLYVLSFGRKKPRWDYFSNESPPRFVIFTEISTWIGFSFWMAVAVMLALLTGR